ncbi:MAG TPA: ABC transporter permease [Opitutaceae bacterium]|nr:ABC transporter permease [Opitutaceae bacterium]
MLNDLRFAFRMIAGHRWFSAAVIVTLALGIGINTTVFTLVNAVLFKPVPIPGGERLVTVMNQDPTDPRRFRGISWPDYLELKQENRTFAGLEAVAFHESVFSEPGIPPERIRGAQVTSGLFNLIQTPPAMGRGFAEADGRAGAEIVVLLGNKVWKNRYSGDPGVVGRAVRLNGKPALIVGVMPEGFHFPNNEDYWMPLVPDADLELRTNRRLTLFGILHPGVTVEEAGADLHVISGRLTEEFPDTNKNALALVRTFHDTYNDGPIRAVFLMMLGAVVFVLLIACANVANMMLSRAVARSREIAVRTAMGASRWQIVRQLLVESVLLSSLGGALGLGFSALGVHAFDLATQDVGKPYWIHFDMDWRAFSYFAVLSVLSGIVFGLVPALRASRVDLNHAMKEGTPGGGSSRGGLAGALVVLQFALTVVLLAGAGMMMRSFFAVQEVNSFVRAENILTARIQLPDGKGEAYDTPLARQQFYEKLLPNLRAIPGVAEVAAVNHLPGLGAGDRKLEFDGRENPDPKNPPLGSMIIETPNYLDAVGLPLLQGRGFNETDGEEGREVAIVSRSFAAKYWPEGDAVGHTFRNLDNETPGPWMTVIGVCADIVQDMQNPDNSPVYHVPYRQQSWAWMGLMIRTTSDPATLAGAVRAAVQELDQDLPLYEVRTLTAALERQRWFLVVFGSLFLCFALAGLLMASVGIYAVVAQATSRRTREIGIRMALGATAARIARLVLSRGLVQLGIGLVIGLTGAFGATHLMANSGLSLQVSPNDPVLFISITAVLVAIGLFACWLPARRAARIAPTEALRTE